MVGKGRGRPEGITQANGGTTRSVTKVEYKEPNRNPSNNTTIKYKVGEGARARARHARRRKARARLVAGTKPAGTNGGKGTAAVCSEGKGKAKGHPTCRCVCVW